MLPRLNPHAAAAWTAAFFLAACLFSHTVALRLLLLLLGTALCAWALIKDRKSVSGLPPIWVAFVAWAAWAALSLGWSLEPDRSVKEFRNEVIYAGLALWTCYIAGQATHAQRVVPAVLSCGAVSLCAIAFYKFGQGAHAYPHGLHGGAGNLSSALLTLMPCATVGAWYAVRASLPRWIAAASAAVMLLFLAAAYTTLNRTVWLGFAAQYVFISIVLSSRRKPSSPRIAVRARPVALLLLTAAVLVAASSMVLYIQAERQSGIGARDLKNDQRFALWSETLEYVRDKPLTGYGFGRGVLRQGLRDEFRDRNLWHSHNVLLDATLQTGAIGLLLLLALLGATAHQGWRMRRDQDDRVAACGVALLAIIIGMLVRNMTDVLWIRQNALLYWGLVGILLSWGRLRTPPSLAEPKCKYS